MDSIDWQVYSGGSPHISQSGPAFSTPNYASISAALSRGGSLQSHKINQQPSSQRSSKRKSSGNRRSSKGAADSSARSGKPFDEEPFELDPSKKQLIVNFLSTQVQEEEFHQIFEQFGPLTVSRVIRDKHTNRPKGYGFVYFCFGEDAIRAIKSLNGFQVYDRRIKVSYADPQRPDDSAQDFDMDMVERVNQSGAFSSVRVVEDSDEEEEEQVSPDDIGDS